VAEPVPAEPVPAEPIPAEPIPAGPIPAAPAPPPPGPSAPVGDGRGRCGWAGSAPEYVAYHDEEWGRPLHGVTAMFERLSLEGFQSGLSWLVILRKRPAFRAAFAGFDPAVVAEFGDADVQRLLADAGIVRNRAKIEATIHNTRRVLELDRPLDELLWSFAPDPATHRRPTTLADVPATSPESVAMARALKRSGLRFVGPTTCYALMQAAGLVDDHVAGCWRAATA
jgi:DNA-3-methyladenine glycosylase I